MASAARHAAAAVELQTAELQAAASAAVAAGSRGHLATPAPESLSSGATEIENYGVEPLSPEFTETDYDRSEVTVINEAYDTELEPDTESKTVLEIVTSLARSASTFLVKIFAICQDMNANCFFREV